MNIISRYFVEEEDGFNGNYEGYVVDTRQENLANWLQREVEDDGKIYNIIQSFAENILIIKNINIDEEFQGQGYGKYILNEALQESEASLAILLCDIGETQKNNFVLENFYISQNFFTVLKYDNYPLMIYPAEMGQAIREKLCVPKFKM